MAISDLLNRVSKRRPDSSRSAFKTRGPERRVTPGVTPHGGAERRAAPDRRTPTARPGGARPPLPSYAILIISALSILCLALSAALVMTVDAQTPKDDFAAAAASDAETEPESEATPQTSFGSEARTIPTDLLTRLEAATDGPLVTELTLLLEAVQIGFGDSSVQLEPTLRTYAYRTSSRFVWDPDSFTVTVQAPDQDLAAARASTLSRLFETALDEGRLTIETATGPHALSLASR